MRFRCSGNMAMIEEFAIELNNFRKDILIYIIINISIPDGLVVSEELRNYFGLSEQFFKG